MASSLLTAPAPAIAQTLGDMESKIVRIVPHPDDALDVVADGADGSGAVGAVAVTVDVPSTLVEGRLGIPSRDVRGEVDVAEIVACVDDADRDGFGGRGKLRGFVVRERCKMIGGGETEGR